MDDKINSKTEAKMENEEEYIQSGIKLDQKRSIWAWALYDWANSAFATTVMAGFFPVFFDAYWAAGAGEDPTVMLGFGNSIASIFVALLAPVLGAIADRASGKKKFLFFFAYLGVLMSASLSLVGQGMWQLAIFCYIMGTIGFSGANIFYDATLPGVASKKKIDYVSSLGFAIGYIGGGILFAINVIMYLFYETFGFASDADAIKASFLSVGIWWGIFAIPIFIFVKEPPAKEGMTIKRAIKEGFIQLKETFTDIKALRVVGLFLLAYWFYIDGVDTIIKMAVDYGTGLGFSSTALIGALLLTQFVAFPGTLLYNSFAKRIGVKKGVLVAIIAYCVITIGGYFMQEEVHFFILAAAVGCFQGGIQALSRSLYSRIIPKEKSGEFYGFFNMLGKFAAILGPSLMSLSVLITQNDRLSILSVLILFIIGGILLSRVDIEKGEKMAKEYLSKEISII
ncbi:MAG: MFS transporter [Promethearchaeota archaeon]